MQRILLGMPGLDRLLGGGLPKVPDVAVWGGEEDGALFSQRLLWNRLNAGDLCLYGTVSRTREEFYNDLVSKGWDVSPFIRAGSLRIVDYLSLADSSPQTPGERLDTLFSMGKEVLVPEGFFRVLTREFHGMRGGDRGRTFIAFLESLDKLIMAMGLDNTLRFKDLISKFLKDTNSVGIGLLCNEFLTRETSEAMRAAASVFIELRRGEMESQIQTMVRVTKLPNEDIPTDWVPLY